MMIRISAPHFVAGAEMYWLKEHRVWACSNAAPIIRYMEGWFYSKITEYTNRKGWVVEWLE